MLDWIQNNPLLVVSALVVCVALVALSFSRRPEQAGQEEPEEQGVIAEPAKKVQQSPPERKTQNVPPQKKPQKEETVSLKERQSEEPAFDVIDGLEIREEGNQVSESSEDMTRAFILEENQPIPFPEPEKKEAREPDLQFPGELDLNFSEEPEKPEENSQTPGSSTPKKENRNSPPVGSIEKNLSEETGLEFPGDLDLRFMEGPEVPPSPGSGEGAPSPKEPKKGNIPLSETTNNQPLSDLDLQFPEELDSKASDEPH
ncbi:MAG: hypothetical protein ACE5FU_05475 [Nitrospinota bacterium]